MKKRLDGYAFEVMHGAHLCGELLDSAMHSAVPELLKRHPELKAAIKAAEDALGALYQTAGRAWDKEAP